MNFDKYPDVDQSHDAQIVIEDAYFAYADDVVDVADDDAQTCLVNEIAAVNDIADLNNYVNEKFALACCLAVADNDADCVNCVK